MVVLTTIFQNALVKFNTIQYILRNIDVIDYHNSDSDNQSVILSLLLFLILQQRHRCLPTPSNRGWTGQEVVDDLLNCGNPIRIHNQLRMKLDTFFYLRDWLVINTRLNSSRNTSIEEKLLIFIYITSTGTSNRAAQERFNRGARVVSLYITTSYFGI